ncbi:MAG: RNA methyltransferase [Bdellovibrionales bacterium]|jgi:tRNA/rRNA methyltransferase
MTKTAPIIILVHPQLVENIGMTARAMANCALPELRIVAPRDPWPLGDIHRQRMMAASSGADDLLENAKHYDTVKDAIADLNYVYATTARGNDMVNRIMTPRAAIPDMIERTSDGQKVGVLFGPERMGLINDYVALANAKITIPLNPDFMSLNLAQTVLLIGYEWYQANDATPENQLRVGKSRPALREEYQKFFDRFEDELDKAGYFVAEDMRPTITRNLQSTLGRAEMTEQEIRSWHGVLSALVDGPKRKKE